MASGPNDDWGCDVCRRGYQVSTFTNTTASIHPGRGAATGKFIFHAECVGDRERRLANRAFDSLADQIARNGDAASA